MELRDYIDDLLLRVDDIICLLDINDNVICGLEIDISNNKDKKHIINYVSKTNVLNRIIISLSNEIMDGLNNIYDIL